MKKWFLRGVVVLGVFVATLVIAAPAMACWDWCDDPILTIGGHNVSIVASIEGDPAQIRGNIEFTVTVPKGTQVSVIFCEPNATVRISYNNSSNSNNGQNGNNNNNGQNGNNNNSSSSYRPISQSIPVDVSVDINSKTVLNTQLTVTLDGQQVAQDQGTTRHDLSCSFTIK